MFSSRLRAFTLLTVALLIAIARCHPAANKDNEPNDINASTEKPIFSRLSDFPNLSTFASLLQSTGPSRTRDPALEDRFNNPNDTTPYTLFAPSNEAFRKIQSSLLETLQKPYSYELLLALIRAHLVKGDINSAALARSSLLISVEGFPIRVDNRSRLISLDRQANVVQADIQAKNGFIHAIDTFIDPFLDYFGVSDSPDRPERGVSRDFLSDGDNRGSGAQEESPGDEIAADYQVRKQLWTSEAAQRPMTMTEIVRLHPQLSNLTSILEAVDPDFLNNRLSDSIRRTGQVDRLAHYFAYSNKAFSSLMPGSVEQIYAPSNRRLAQYLLEFGYTTDDVDLSTVQSRDDEGLLARSSTGLQFEIVSTRGAIRVQNAIVQGEPLCVRNGCIWLIDRFLDPVMGRFGALKRQST